MSGRARKFEGIGASQGVAIGRVFLLDRREVRVPRFHVRTDQVGYERRRLREAIDKSVAQLRSIRERFSDEGMSHQAILEAHEMMVRDEGMLAEAEKVISDDQVNAEWAISRVIARYRELFDRLNDSYFRERRTDVDSVGERILRNLVGQVADLQDMDQMQDGTVVVAHDLSPVDAFLFSRHRVSAFVTEAGGKTSHTSIVARSLGVPAVVGATGVFDAAGSGDTIMVDGLDGTVVVCPTTRHLEIARRRAARYQRVSLDLLEAKALPARTIDGFDIGIAGNIELPNEVATVLDRGGEAIGLYRTEFMFLGRRTPPGEEIHFRTYCQLFDEVGDRPVTIRTFDLGGDKVFYGQTSDNEPNPALGLRGVRYCLDHPEVFEPQLAGLLRASTRGNLKILLPMLSSIHELRQVQDLVNDIANRLAAEGKAHNPRVPIGIMVEVPSAVLTSDLLASEADFFSIGTNDLMQYLLAIDRTNDRVAYLYDPLHPAMLRTLKMVTDAARNAKIPISICGEVAGDPEYTAMLLALGLDELSMDAGSIPQIKRLVRELDRNDCVGLFEEALACVTVHEVGRLVHDFLSAKAPMARSIWDEPEPA